MLYLSINQDVNPIKSAKTWLDIPPTPATPKPSSEGFLI